SPLSLFLFFSPHPAPTDISTLSLHDALPISRELRDEAVDLVGGVVVDEADAHRVFRVRQLLPQAERVPAVVRPHAVPARRHGRRSEEHTSELQSRSDLVCRLLLEKKKKINIA